jgi:transmembrane sensor
MNTQDNEIYSLIAKSFTSKLSDDEQRQLAEWKALSRENLKEFNDFCEIWKISGKMAMPETIDLPESLKQTRQEAGIEKNNRIWLYIRQAAAVLVLAVTLSGIYNYFGKKDEPLPENVVYQEVKATYGTQTRVELADGSQVVLNSGSSLRFPVLFSNQKLRKVQLMGEGQFSVSKDASKPFVVDAQGIQVKVLGTVFNVNAYPENNSVTVALLEGKVKLQKESAGIEEILAELKPNQVANFEKTNGKILVKTEDDLAKYTAWTEGKIVFADDAVQTVIQKLENWYNVDIELGDKRLEHYRFTGTFINEPIEQILSILSMTSKMTYTINAAQKQADNSYSKRKITLKTK